MDKIKGPTEITIPEQRHLVCNSCLYFEKKLKTPGKNPKYRYRCEHHAIPHNLKMSYGSNIQDDIFTGYVKTPDWCPFLINKEKVDGNS